LLSDLGDGEVLDVVSDGVLLSHDGLPLDSMVLMSSTLRITPPGDHDGRQSPHAAPARRVVGGGRSASGGGDDDDLAGVVARLDGRHGLGGAVEGVGRADVWIDESVLDD